MDMEKRVLALEYQMKILKNEIQRLLLQVQENILIHYYPALELEIEELPVKNSPKKKSIAADETDIAIARKDKVIPEPIKMTTLEEIKKQSPAGSDVDVRELDVRPDAGSQDLLVELSEWASTGVASIGGERARKMIEGFVARGWIDSKNHDLLLRLVSMNRDDKVSEIVSANQLLGLSLQLTRILGSNAEIDEILTLIEEAGLG